jgi:hypothetical protein
MEDQFYSNVDFFINRPPPKIPSSSSSSSSSSTSFILPLQSSLSKTSRTGGKINCHSKFVNNRSQQQEKVEEAFRYIDSLKDEPDSKSEIGCINGIQYREFIGKEERVQPVLPRGSSRMKTNFDTQKSRKSKSIMHNIGVIRRLRTELVNETAQPSHAINSTSMKKGNLVARRIKHMGNFDISSKSTDNSLTCKKSALDFDNLFRNFSEGIGIRQLREELNTSRARMEATRQKMSEIINMR